MKKIILLSVIVSLLFVLQTYAFAGDYNYIYESADKSVKEYISEDVLNSETEIIKYLSPKEIYNFVRKNLKIIFPSVKPIVENMTIVLLAASLGILISDKNLLSVYDIALSVVCVLLLHSAVYPVLSGSFIKLVSLNGFLSTIYSYMSAGLALGNKNVSAGVMPSVIVGIITLMSNVISVFFVPLLNGLLAVSYASAIENGVLTRFFNTFKNVMITLITVVGIFFSGVTGLQKYITSAGDSISMSTAKYLISGSMPIVGGVVKEAFGKIVASSKMIVSTSGIFGIISVVILLVPNLLKLAVVSILLKVGLIISEEIGQMSLKSVFKGCTGVFEIITALYVCEMMYVIISISLLISSA